MNILFSLLLMFQVQPNNEPVWMWMPTDTVEQRADKEVARKEFAEMVEQKRKEFVAV